MSKKGTPRDLLNAAQRADVITRYLEGEPYKSLAERYAITDSAIWGVVSRAQVLRNRRLLSESDFALCNAVCTSSRIRGVKQDAPPDKDTYRGKKLGPNPFLCLTPESAYWLGMLTADGSIVLRKESGSWALVLQLTEPDGYQVERFRSFLGAEHKITEIASGTTSQGLHRRKCYRISIVSNKLVSSIRFYGIAENKTTVVNLRFVNEHPDFWRGVIDGDGHIRLSKTGSLELLGSPSLTTYFCGFCLKIFPKAKFRVRKRPGVSLCTMTGRTAAIVLYALYGTAGPALLRKQIVATQIYKSYQ